MNLFNATGQSWKLFQSAVFVIRKHPRLFLFPFLIAGFTLIIAAFFMTPVFITMVPIVTKAVNNPQHHNVGPFEAMAGSPHWIVPYSLLVYPLSMLLATFCNVAFYSQIIAALNGQPVSIGRGFKIAASRIKPILIWSLFAGFVGAVIRETESYFGFVGRLVMGLIGLSWSVASVFVIPIIIREPGTMNPVKILGKSAGTLKRTWGESLFGYVGLRAANAVVLVVGMILFFAAGLLACVLHTFWIIIPAWSALLLGMVAYFCFASLASQTYLCALYIYASEGVIPEPYNQQMLDEAWKVKKG